MNRASRKRLIGALKDDRGVAALVIAALIAIVAFTALEVYLNNFVSTRALQRAQSSSSSQSHLVQAVYAAFLKSSSTSPTLPCPDIDSPPTGKAGGAAGAAATCTGNTVTGVLPWQALGLSQDDVIDPYGDYYTYVMSGKAQTMCYAVSDDYQPGSANSEITGSLTSASDLQVTVATPSSTRNIAFAIIGHGPNRKGAKSKTNTTLSPVSPHEKSNKDPTAKPNGETTATVYVDNYTTDATNYFDDQVFVPSNADMEKICKSMIAGGQLNAQLGANFDSASDRSATNGTPDTTKFASSGATVVADARTAVSTTAAGNYVASMATAGAYLATSTTSTYNFDPTVRPVYVSATWIPVPTGTATDAGMSIATRASVADQTAGTDDFNSVSKEGITFRFFCGTGDAGSCTGSTGADILAGTTTTGGQANYISIRNDGAKIGSFSTASYQLKLGKAYTIEAYDDGTNVWARITEQDNLSNTAYVSTTTTSDRFTGSQQVVFINHTTSTDYLDDVVVGVPMLAVETTNSSLGAVTTVAATSYVTSAAAAVTISGSFTVEAWVRPLEYPSGTHGNTASTIISLWDPDNTGGNNAFRLYINNEGLLYLDLAGKTGQSETGKSTGIVLKTNTWTHIAVTVDGSTKTVSHYQDGVLTSKRTTAITDIVGTGSSEQFTVGADVDKPGASAAYQNGFWGDVSDLRLWSTVRASDKILANFEKRLPLTAVSQAPDTLALNWKFDQESGGLAATTVTSTGTSAATASSAFVGAHYVASLGQYFRPFSDSTGMNCPSGTKVGAYRCDFRSAGYNAITVPNNLYAMFAKAWGAGGGVYKNGNNLSGGGGGGFSAGYITKITNVSTTSIPGQIIDVIVGGGGTGSTSVSSDGAGGGGASGIQLTAPSVALSAGGGGGASYTSSTEGSGGAGGGIGSNAGTASDSTGTCGGRGGDSASFGADPPHNGGNRCGGGGTDPTTAAGASGGGTALGGSSYFGASNNLGSGGAGASPGSNIGAGGGGGGVNIVDATTGGGEEGGYKTNGSAGYGGGGGGHFGNGALVYATGAAASSSFSDTTCKGDLTSGSTAVASITCSSGNPVVNGWTTGMSIVETNGGGSDISAGTTIVSVTTTTAVLSQAAAGNQHGAKFNVTSTGGSAGTTDFYYNVTSTIGTTANPGLGGNSSTDSAGHAGAVVLIW